MWVFCALVRQKTSSANIGFTTAWLTLVVAVFATSCSERHPIESMVEGRPIEVTGERYASSRTCEACHPQEYSTWHSSYHRTMTQVVKPETVVGEFDGVKLKVGQRHLRLERRGDEFWFRTQFRKRDEPATESGWSERRVVLSTGSHHMQVYWAETENARTLEMLPFSYLVDEQRWVRRRSNFLLPPERSESSNRGEWNRNCVGCHTTGGQPRMTNSGQFDTKVAEFGIACEACHGPAARHVSLNRNPERRYALHLSDEGDPSIMLPSRMSGARASQVCGQCHSVNLITSPEEAVRYYREGSPYVPGDDLFESVHVVRGDDHPSVEDLGYVEPGFLDLRFWPDGMVRVSGREYNGLLDSPCAVSPDFSCLTCHDMHPDNNDPRELAEWANDQLRVGFGGNAACVGCHAEIAADIPAHSLHPVDSTGSQCMNCHMPHTTYGLLKAIRSHQIDSPSVQDNLDTGRPNACNLCHLDQTLAWTAGELPRWGTLEEAVLDEDESRYAAGVLWALRGDAGVRALVAWHFGWAPAQAASGTDWMVPFLAELLTDPYDAVRFIAGRSLRTVPGHEDNEFDFVARVRERSAVQERVFEQWRRDGSPLRGPRDALMLDDEGGLAREAFNRLLAARDRRDVALLE
ncbi:C cytochrome precursor [Myxococcota bacterium]|nr:C cytochrome precursor [Myxococcota bacterium]